MRFRFLTIVIAIALLVLTYIAYCRRFQIEAKVWHWRHGDIVAVGKYEIPVPSHWLVFDRAWNSALLIDTSTQSHRGGFQTNPTIAASSVATSPHDLSLWATTEQQMLERNGLRVVEQRTLEIHNKSVYCVGGSELRAILHIPDTKVISLQCRSTGTLSLTFSVPQSSLAGFYAIGAAVHTSG